MFTTSISQRFKRIEESDLKIKPEFKKVVVNEKLTMSYMVGDYKKKIERVKDIITQKARWAYLNGWVINETDEEIHDYIIHYFNILKQDVYIVWFLRDGIHAKINHVKHNYELTVEKVIQNYLVWSHEDHNKLNTTGDMVTMVEDVTPTVFEVAETQTTKAGKINDDGCFTELLQSADEPIIKTDVIRNVN